MAKDDLLGAAAGPKMQAIDVFSYPSEKCPNCGNEVFIPGIIFKKIPGVLVGEGKDEVQAPLKVFVCSKCGELSPVDKKMMDDAKKHSSEQKKSNLII